MQEKAIPCQSSPSTYCIKSVPHAPNTPPSDLRFDVVPLCTHSALRSWAGKLFFFFFIPAVVFAISAIIIYAIDQTLGGAIVYTFLLTTSILLAIVAAGAAVIYFFVTVFKRRKCLRNPLPTILSRKAHVQYQATCTIPTMMMGRVANVRLYIYFGCGLICWCGVLIFGALDLFGTFTTTVSTILGAAGLLLLGYTAFTYYSMRDACRIDPKRFIEYNHIPLQRLHEYSPYTQSQLL